MKREDIERKVQPLVEEIEKLLTSKGVETKIAKAMASSYRIGFLGCADRVVVPLRTALEKIADPRKRDHREPDPQTELYCVMNIAEEALK